MVTILPNGNIYGTAGAEDVRNADIAAVASSSIPDLISLLGGDDRLILDYGTAFGFDINAPLETAIDTGDGADTVVLQGFGALFGTAVSVYTRDGDDYVSIQAPIDLDSSLLVDGGAGNDRLLGSFGEETLKGGIGDDTINGNGGDDRLFGNAGADLLAGGTGDDTIFGGSENDTVFGNAGDDVLRGDAGDDLLVGGTGDDRLVGGAGSDRLNGQDGDDSVWGGTGDDFLFAGLGSDYMSGGAGDDTLQMSRFAAEVADGGIDFANGGAGNDTLVYVVDTSLIDGDVYAEMLDLRDNNDPLTRTLYSELDLRIEGIETIVFLDEDRNVIDLDNFFAVA